MRGWGWRVRECLEGKRRGWGVVRFFCQLVRQIIPRYKVWLGGWGILGVMGDIDGKVLGVIDKIYERFGCEYCIEVPLITSINALQSEFIARLMGMVVI